jgi:hydrogenase maturation factor HypF (carbamoyltransferase family)
MIRCHVFVSGQVQGVFYRAFAKENAERLSLTGFVRNMPDFSYVFLCELSWHNKYLEKKHLYQDFLHRIPTLYTK